MLLPELITCTLVADDNGQWAWSSSRGRVEGGTGGLEKGSQGPWRHFLLLLRRWYVSYYSVATKAVYKNAKVKLQNPHCGQKCWMQYGRHQPPLPSLNSLNAWPVIGWRGSTFMERASTKRERRYGGRWRLIRPRGDAIVTGAPYQGPTGGDLPRIAVIILYYSLSGVLLIPAGPAHRVDVVITDTFPFYAHYPPFFCFCFSRLGTHLISTARPCIQSYLDI